MLVMDNPQKLTKEQGRLLVTLARGTLNQLVGREPVADPGRTLPDDPVLHTPGALFVTLKKHDRLRGCIGSLEGREPLAQGVRTYAEHAALHDPRFAPLSADELDQVTIEVSVLTPPQRLAYTDGKELLARLRPGVDGVIVRKGSASATFLPQVWEQLPRPEEFLSQLCLKAGLSADEWRRGRLDIAFYQVQAFKESC